MSLDEGEVARVLREAGARFAFVHGSRATGELARPNSDLDVGAWWGHDAPNSWTVFVPNGTDLVVLDTAPLWLARRIAQHGRLLFDDDPRARVRWQADTRLLYPDDLPGHRSLRPVRRPQPSEGVASWLTGSACSGSVKP